MMFGAIYMSFETVDAVPAAWVDVLGFAVFLFFIGFLFLNFAFGKERKRVEDQAQTSAMRDEDIIYRLNKLKALLDGGLISEDDYEEKKREILRGL